MNKNKKLVLKYNESKIDSLIVALSLMSISISATISVGLGIENNANVIVLALIFVCYFIKIMQTKRLWLDIDYGSMGLLLMILALFGLSKFFNGNQCNYTFIQLLFYAILPKLSMDLNFKTNYVLKYSLHLSIITVLAVNGFFEYQYEDMNQAYMGNIYPIVTMIIIALFHFRFYRHEASKFTWICYLYNVYMTVRVIMVANRGALLCIVCAIIVLFLYKFDEEEKIKKNSVKQLIFILVAVIAILFIYYNQLAIIQNCISFFGKVFGNVPSFFIKMERYILLDDVSNGRSTINEVFYEAFKESPVWGHGMRTFSSYTNNLYPYPHNFIYQYLFEGGLLFATIPIFYAVKIVFDVLLGRIESKEEYVMAAMLVCQCYPKLLVSTEVWQGTAIWMLITYSYICTKKIKKQKGLKQNNKLVRKK